MTEIAEARERIIANKAATGLPYGYVCQAGIRGGQWDRGSLIREAVFALRREVASIEEIDE